MNPPDGTCSLRAHGQTDRGLIRLRNEDHFLCDEAHRVFAVADGLGGLPQGDLASETAIDGLQHQINAATAAQPLDWKKIFGKINRRVIKASARHEHDINLGTTLTTVQVLPGRRLNIGHVGDSGVFLFRRNEVIQITTDHTLAQLEISRRGGKVARDLPESYTHTLTRCLGQPDPLQVDVIGFPVAARDRLLLYTDGITKTWDLPGLQQAVRAARDPRQLVQTLLEEANARGGPDNATAVAIFL